MRPILENAILGSDLDCQNFDLLRVRAFKPVPSGLAQEGDQLDGPRPLPSGSVFNYHVATSAKIEQEKLALNGLIPTDWFYVIPVGDEPELTQRAARGSLAELVSRKGTANGYAGLDSNGRLPASAINTGAGAGTVSAVKLAMPPELTVGGTNPIEASGSFNVSWAATPDNSWLGVFGVGLSPILKPSFLTKQLPSELIPDLSATKFISGVFPVEQLPVAIGMGAEHTPGIVPDTGEHGDPGDYLGRDMNWHQFSAGQNYQPLVPKVQIVLNSSTSVTVRTTLPGSTLFYRRHKPTDVVVWPFSQAPSDSVTLSVLPNDYIEAYASKAGYNNSGISEFLVPTFSGATT